MKQEINRRSQSIEATVRFALTGDVPRQAWSDGTRRPSFDPDSASVKFDGESGTWVLVSISVSGPVITAKGNRHATRRESYSWGPVWAIRGSSTADPIEFPDWLEPVVTEAMSDVADRAPGGIAWVKP